MGILAHLSRAFSDASSDLMAVCDIHWQLISLRNRIPSGETRAVRFPDVVRRHPRREHAERRFAERYYFLTHFLGFSRPIITQEGVSTLHVHHMGKVLCDWCVPHYLV